MINIIKSYRVAVLDLQYSWKRCMTSGPQKKAKNFLADIAGPEQVPTEYWEKVLWVAIDLKKAVVESNKQNLNLLNNKHVTIFLAKPHGRFLLAYTLACDLLGARKTVYQDEQCQAQGYSFADSSKQLSRLTDMFVTYGLHQEVLFTLAENATVPVFSASCNIHCLQKGLADLMTFFEKQKKLKGLTLAWVGSPNAIFNTYLFLCTKFGMNVRYVCICLYGSGRMSPRQKVLLNDSRGSVKEFKTAEETVSNAHFIATAMHPDKKFRIDLKLLENANKNWYFMHTLPRTDLEVSDEVFHHANNLSWEASENYLYVAMGVIVTNLLDYKPKIPKPNFSGEKEGS